MLSVSAVHFNDAGFVAIHIGIFAGAAERFRPVHGESLSMIWMKAVTERMTHHFVAQYAVMPRMRKAAHAVDSVRRFQDTLHALYDDNRPAQLQDDDCGAATMPSMLDVVRRRAQRRKRHVCQLRNDSAKRSAMLASVRPVVGRARQKKRTGACVAEQCARLAPEIVSDELIRIAYHRAKVVRGVGDIVRADETQECGIFGRERATPELLEIRRRIKPWILLDDGPDERGKWQNVTVGKDRIHQIAWLAAMCERHELVDGEIDRMQHDTAAVERDEWKKAPCGFVRPVDFGRVAGIAHARFDEARELRVDDHLPSSSSEGVGIAVERVVCGVGRGMKKIQVGAVPLPFNAEVKRRAACEVRVTPSAVSESREHLRLKRCERHATTTRCLQAR